MSTPPFDPDNPSGQNPPPPFEKPSEPSYGQAPPPPGGPYQHPGPPQPGAYTTGPLMSDADQRMWATLGHLSPLLFSFVGPLVIYLLMKDRGHFIRNQSLEALNFQITLAIASVVLAILGILTLGIGFLVLFAVAVAAVVFMIMAAIAANRGEEYKYPFTMRLVS